MKIATWNVNSIKARLDNALAWVGQAKPDVLCLQELKCEDHAFPAPAFEAVDADGKTRKLSEFAGKTVILEWTNHDCPY
eukprot:gene30958-31535_t